MTDVDMIEQSGKQYDWYDLVTDPNSFEQGDIFIDFPLLIPTSETLTGKEAQLVDVKIEEHDVILMTHSCDLLDLPENGFVLLCDLWSFEQAYGDLSLSKKRDKWKSLIRGQIVHSHILGKCEIENHYSDYMIVTLNTVFTTPFSLLKEFAHKQASRVRLLPPYREHLSQAFARQFMRVGLPSDLPRSYPENNN